MKNAVLLTGLFLVAYLVFIIASVPASFMSQLIPLPHHVVMGKAKGTLWQAEIEYIRYQDFAVNNIVASVSPFSLLMLSPTVELTFGGALLSGPQGKSQVTYRFGEIDLSKTTMSIAANEVVPFLPLPLPIDAYGQVDLSLEQLTINEMMCDTAKGTLMWQRAAATAMEQTVELGSFSGQIKCDQQRYAIELNPDNRLGLSYLGAVDFAGKIYGSGFIKPGADFPAELKQALPFISHPDDQGRYPLSVD